MPPETDAQTLSSPIGLVCFDLGGVLVHVAHTWAEAMTDAGLEPTPGTDVKLDAIPAFLEFQAGQLSLEAYRDELAAFLQVSPELALKAHNHILMDPTEGTEAIIIELEQAGVRTGCLSNTNTPHWAELTSSRYPAIARLQTKAASQLLGANKPDPAIYRAYEAEAGVSAKEILFFDDGIVNVEGALAVGWNSVRIDPFGNQAAQLRAALIEYGVLPSTESSAS